METNFEAVNQVRLRHSNAAVDVVCSLGDGASDGEFFTKDTRCCENVIGDSKFSNLLSLSKEKLLSERNVSRGIRDFVFEGRDISNLQVQLVDFFLGMQSSREVFEHFGSELKKIFHGMFEKRFVSQEDFENVKNLIEKTFATDTGLNSQNKKAKNIKPLCFKILKNLGEKSLYGALSSACRNISKKF